MRSRPHVLYGLGGRNSGVPWTPSCSHAQGTTSAMSAMRRSMMTARRALLGVLVFFASVAQSAAQARVPDAGMSAVAGNIGIIVPKDPFETDIALSGTFEHYLTPR